jgi:DNA-binding IclR family transcriptional regulator
MSGGSADPGRTVVSRALALLMSFDPEHPRLTLAELSRRSGVALTTAHRLVAALAEGQALVRRPDGQYEIGRRLWSIGLLAPVNQDLREIALPFLQDLHTATGQTVHIAVRDGLSALYVERIVGTGSTPVLGRAGTALPLHATGVGKALLAFAPPEVVAAVLSAPSRVTPYTITEPGRLERELAEVRRRGFARTGEEMTLGASSVAVPIMGADGTPVAAVGIVVASSRRDLLRFVPGLRVAALAIGRQLRSPGEVVFR